ncbi:MAG: Rossmann-like domain-containing protein [Bacteroidota bacterium]
MIIERTYKLLKSKYSELIDNITIEKVCIGVFLTAVRLSDNSSGVASTMPSPSSQCLKKNRRFDDFSPSKISGQLVRDLFECSPQNNITDTLKLAVLNALSSKIINNGNYKIIEDADPIDILDLNSKKKITLVGAFNSYIRKISETNSELKVLEFNESSFIEEHRRFYVPANEYIDIIPKSDIVVITGLTLVNNTIGGLLDVISPHSKVVLTGPSSSLIPDILFENKVDIIGATRINDSEMLFKVVSEGGTGFHLFKYCATKICILKE